MQKWWDLSKLMTNNTLTVTFIFRIEENFAQNLLVFYSFVADKKYSFKKSFDLHFYPLIIGIFLSSLLQFTTDKKIHTKAVVNPSRPDPGQRENIYFKFYLKGLHKTFWGTTKKCENKNLKSESHLPKKFVLFASFESPLKMMNNAFYFLLKAFFFLKIFRFLSWLFGHAE